jgi:hypothetical protein
MSRRSRHQARCLTFLAVCAVGCGRPPSSDSDRSSKTAAVSYEASFLHREMSPNGPVLIESPKAVSATARPLSAVTVENFGMKATVQVLSVEKGKATFQVTCPDGSTHPIDVNEGESKDLFENGRAAGVRIKVTATTS